MKDFHYITKTLTIKREIQATDEIHKWVDHNIRYRNRVYNRGVEYLHELDKQNEDRDVKRWFKQYEWDNYYYNTYEAKGCPDHDLFMTTVTDIRMFVARDLKMSNDKVHERRKKGLPSQAKFRKYDKYSGSFGFRNNRQPNSDIRNRIIFSNHGKFVKINIRNQGVPKDKRYITLNLKESVKSNKKYKFTKNDIIECYIVREVDKIFINFITEVKIKVYHCDKIHHAGIDLGERNNFAIYDGIEKPFIKNIFDVDDIKYMNHLLDRISSVQSHMDKKIKGSNSYNKVYFKFRKLHKKLYNFKMDKIHKLATVISRKYKTIIVDEFYIPISSIDDKSLSIEVRKRINKKLLNINSMGYMKRILKDTSENYNCIYLKALPYTTRTCSKCGFINEALDLTKRKLHCNCCGTKIDRDINASINCYRQYNELMYIIDI